LFLSALLFGINAVFKIFLFALLKIVWKISHILSFCNIPRVSIRFPYIYYCCVDRNIIDAFSDGMLLLKLANVGLVALQHYEEEIESALKEVRNSLVSHTETSDTIVLMKVRNQFSLGAKSGLFISTLWKNHVRN
jgi:hypothetical protein